MNIAVIGTGKLGSLHAKFYAQMPEVTRLFLCDIDAQKTADLLKQLGGRNVTAVSDYTQLVRYRLDAVSIATPTATHYEIGRFFLSRSIHCLIEKPITTSLKEARQLYRLARAHKAVLMVGHVERFNSAYREAKKIIKNPLFIECHRLSPYPARSLDISVVLDLMIHDLDIVLDLVKDTPVKIEATGIKVLSAQEDIANVRIAFKKGCIANITASRISAERVRKIRVFTRDSYVSLDYATQEIAVYKKEKHGLAKTQLEIEKDQPLKNELAFFMKEIRSGKKPFLPDHALSALSLALRIQKKMSRRHG